METKTPTEYTLRPEPNRMEANSYYRVYYGMDQADAFTPGFGSSRILELSDVVRFTSYYYVEVDGYRYDRVQTISGPRFFNVRNDFTHNEDDENFDPEHPSWDSPHTYATKCLACSADWQMNEEKFLRTGELLCGLCKADGLPDGNAGFDAAD
jgi:hypothetical protein